MHHCDTRGGGDLFQCIGKRDAGVGGGDFIINIILLLLVVVVVYESQAVAVKLHEVEAGLDGSSAAVHEVPGVEGEDDN